MTKKLITTSNNLPALSFDGETIDLIKRTVANGATNDELQLFIYQAKRAGLDPLARQIYFVKRAGRVVIQTSIDGFRLVAQRSGEYAGQDAPEWFKTRKGDELYAKVTVYKFGPNGQRYPAAVGVAYWSEYCPAPGQDFMWKKMPRTMIAKVAEALALRKAFPQELSGLYTDEEMDQAGKDQPVKPQATQNNVPSKPAQKPQEETREVLEGQTVEEDENGEVDPDWINERQANEFPKEENPEDILDGKEEPAKEEKKPICVCRTTNQFHSPRCPAHPNNKPTNYP